MESERGKKAFSEVVVSVLFVLVVIIIIAIIIIFATNFISRMRQSSAERGGNIECSLQFKLQMSGCIDTSNRTILIDIINMQKEIMTGSQVAIIGETDTEYVPVKEFEVISQGTSKELIIDIPESMDIESFGIKEARFMPVYIYKEYRILCNDLPPIKIEECF